MQFKQANQLNSNSTLSEKTENKTNPLTSRYSSNAATKATTTDSLAKESKSLGKIELCCMKAKKRVLSLERHSVQIGDVFQKSKGQNVRLKMSKSRKSVV
jgi:hypothetical protein